MANEQTLENVKKGTKNLSFANLSSADLRSADLRSADLRSADLRSANLSGADLRRANLSGADLSEANLNGADLRSADLRRADLSGADLSEANLNGVDLRRVDLSRTNLSGADLNGVKGLSSREEELGYIRLIKEEIVSKGRLEQSQWHSIDGASFSSLDWIDAQTLLQCGATHCAAGSAQLFAVLAGKKEFLSIPAAVAGSMLVPSLAVDFFASNEEMIKRIDGILSGEIPLLDR